MYVFRFKLFILFLKEVELLIEQLISLNFFIYGKSKLSSIFRTILRASVEVRDSNIFLWESIVLLERGLIHENRQRNIRGSVTVLVNTPEIWVCLLNGLSNVGVGAPLPAKDWCFAIDKILDNQLVSLLDGLNGLCLEKCVFLNIKNDGINFFSHLRGNAIMNDGSGSYSIRLVKTGSECVFSIVGLIWVVQVKWSCQASLCHV